MLRRTFLATAAASLIRVRGSRTAQDTLNRAFAIFAGRPDNHTLGKLVVTDPAGARHFINDNVWWLWTDSQCNYHATWGWRPFFDPAYRQIDRTTWTTPFRYQVTAEMQDFFRRQQKAPKVPPVGWLPHSYDPLKKHRVVSDSVTQYYANAYLKKESIETSIGMDHGENTDYALQNLITALDWCLWERDIPTARQYLPRMDAFLEAIRRQEQSNGLILTFTQASQVEYGHLGWRHPGPTHVYLLAIYPQMAEVARLAALPELEKKYRARAEALTDRLPLLLEQDQWFRGGIAPDGRTPLGHGRLDGSPSDYFEVWHNVNAAVLGVGGDRRARTIVAKLRSIPALTENHLTLVNYPARPESELDRADWYPKAGQHVNAGWLWMASGSALGAHARTGHPATLDEAARLLDDFDRHLTIDYYNDYGRNKEKQWPERGKESYSVTSAGAFGMLFRGLLDLRPTARGISLRPNLPTGIDSLEFDWPIHYAGKQLKVILDRKKGTTVQGLLELPYDTLPAASTLTVRVPG